jgi:hypothetical protein
LNCPGVSHCVLSSSTEVSRGITGVPCGGRSQAPGAGSGRTQRGPQHAAMTLGQRKNPWDTGRRGLLTDPFPDSNGGTWAVRPQPRDGHRRTPDPRHPEWQRRLSRAHLGEQVAAQPGVGRRAAGHVGQECDEPLDFVQHRAGVGQGPLLLRPGQPPGAQHTVQLLLHAACARGWAP